MKPGLRAGSRYTEQFRDAIRSANVASPATILGEKLGELQLGVADKLAVLHLAEEVSKTGNLFKNLSCVAERSERDKSVIGIFARND